MGFDRLMVAATPNFSQVRTAKVGGSAIMSPSRYRRVSIVVRGQVPEYVKQLEARGYICTESAGRRPIFSSLVKTSRTRQKGSILVSTMRQFGEQEAGLSRAEDEDSEAARRVARSILLEEEVCRRSSRVKVFHSSRSRRISKRAPPLTIHKDSRAGTDGALCMMGNTIRICKTED